MTKNLDEAPLKYKKMWTPREDQTLLEILREKSLQLHTWEVISNEFNLKSKERAHPADIFIPRNAKRCRERWWQHLNPELNTSSDWENKQIADLFSLFEKYPQKWSTIATELIRMGYQRRSDTQIKNFMNLKILGATKKINVAIRKHNVLVQKAKRKQYNGMKKYVYHKSLSIEREVIKALQASNVKKIKEEEKKASAEDNSLDHLKDAKLQKEVESKKVHQVLMISERSKIQKFDQMNMFHDKFEACQSKLLNVIEDPDKFSDQDLLQAGSFIVEYYRCNARIHMKEKKSQKNSEKLYEPDPRIRQQIHKELIESRFKSVFMQEEKIAQPVIEQPVDIAFKEKSDHQSVRKSQRSKIEQIQVFFGNNVQEDENQVKQNEAEGQKAVENSPGMIFQSSVEYLPPFWNNSSFNFNYEPQTPVQNIDNMFKSQKMADYMLPMDQEKRYAHQEDDSRNFQMGCVTPVGNNMMFQRQNTRISQQIIMNNSIIYGLEEKRGFLNSIPEIKPSCVEEPIDSNFSMSSKYSQFNKHIAKMGNQPFMLNNFNRMQQYSFQASMMKMQPIGFLNDGRLPSFSDNTVFFNSDMACSLNFGQRKVPTLAQSWCYEGKTHESAMNLQKPNFLYSSLSYFTPHKNEDERFSNV